jgi:hypothetical protein
MSIADFEQILTLMPIPSSERSVLREGYSILLGMGWPPCYINWKMCVRGFAGMVPPYEGAESWTAYKREWAWADNRRLLPATNDAFGLSSSSVRAC